MAFLSAMVLLCVLGMQSTTTTIPFQANGQKLASSTVLRTTKPLFTDNDVHDMDHGPSMTLPTHFAYLTNNNNRTMAGLHASTPVLWSIPRTGSNTLAQILGECRGMVLAGAYHGQSSTTLGVVLEHNVKMINADLSTPQARSAVRAKGLQDIHANVVLLSSNLLESSQVFSDSFQAELWAWFRHPIERQISTYFTMKANDVSTTTTTTTTTMGRPQTMSLTEWVASPYHEPNFFLRSLLGTPSSRTMGWTELDLSLAKNVLRQKGHIALLEQKAESVRRFLARHGTVGSTTSGSLDCEERLLDYGWTTKSNHPKVGTQTDAYRLLLQANGLDMELYEYAKYLFQLQSEF